MKKEKNGSSGIAMVKGAVEDDGSATCVVSLHAAYRNPHVVIPAKAFTVVHEGMLYFFFSSSSRPTRSTRDWSSDVCSSDLPRRSRCGPKPTARASCARSRLRWNG